MLIDFVLRKSAIDGQLPRTGSQRRVTNEFRFEPHPRPAGQKFVLWIELQQFRRDLRRLAIGCAQHDLPVEAFERPGIW